MTLRGRSRSSHSYAAHREQDSGLLCRQVPLVTCVPVTWWTLDTHVITVFALKDSSEVRPVAAYFLVVNGSRREDSSRGRPCVFLRVSGFMCWSFPALLCIRESLRNEHF